MTSIYKNVFSNEELDYLNNHPEVLLAKSSLDSKLSGKIYFSVPITNSIRDTLQSQFGLDLSQTSQIPMRWIKGDTAPHMDIGSSNFKNTYLLYLNDSPGQLIVDSESYPIEHNTGFVFNEGIYHESKYTENVPRLLLGPMNEFVQPVGILPTPGIFYYASEADALSYTNSLGYGGSGVFTVGENVTLGITSWMIASNSNGDSPQNVVYANGSVLSTIPDGPEFTNYYLYPNAPVVCYAKGTLILTKHGFTPIENIKAGDKIVTKGKIKKNMNGPRNFKIEPVMWISKFKVINLNSSSRPICIKKDTLGENYPFKDLYVSPEHSLFLNGKMVLAKNIVNEETIYQDKECKNVEYYHLECEEHSLIIANGILAESYFDSNNRDVFENSITLRNKNNLKKIYALG